jgi:hypothetical protein
MSGFILMCLCFAVVLGWIDGGRKVSNYKPCNNNQSPNYFISFFFFE